MYLTAILPQLRGLSLDRVDRYPGRIILTLHARSRSAACPVCRRLSRGVHSRYRRVLADCPIEGTAVTLHLLARRFYCRRRACPRKVFCERFPQLTRPHGRRTEPLRAALEALGFALGGNPGARLAALLGLPASRMSLLRLVQAAPLPSRPTPEILGVDDWARKRGRSYGTILVDLGRHRVIDLLPDRTAETLAAWLAAHPGVRVVSRDRAGAYADGARQGAPAARQVADRFHLVKNAGEQLEQVLIRRHAALRQAARPHLLPDAAPASAAEPPPPPVTPLPQARRASRQARYTEVPRLLAQGHSQRAVARSLGISREAVGRFARADTFPERAPRAPRPTILAPFEPYLRARWTAGERNAHTLWAELRARGYRGSASYLRRYLGGWRTTPAPYGRPARQFAAQHPLPAPVRTFTPRQTRWLLLAEPEELDGEERAFLARLTAACPEVAHAQGLVRRFLALLRTREGQGLGQWLAAAAASGIPELGAFVRGLRRDAAAVDAALTTDISNGQTEGSVNKLKTLKRQMGGRAGLPLLRHRLLGAA